MKKLIMMMVLAAGIVGTAVAQEKPAKGEKKHFRKERFANVSPEQMASLKTKKTTLALGLTQKQQDDLYKLNLDQAKDRKQKFEAFKKAREEKKEFSKDDRFKMMNNRLDAQIVYQRKVQSILSEKQFAQWKKMQMHEKQKMVMRMNHFRKAKHDGYKMRKSEGKK
ncbi:hypothetical protein ACG2LH_04300 [Zhouia sp. PK063]|uniref:hypothetical protein n=1 Tax=Zhouia sp. PK063 TaxID=3373602 RepID=UPI0037ACE14D